MKGRNRAILDVLEKELSSTRCTIDDEYVSALRTFVDDLKMGSVSIGTESETRLQDAESKKHQAKRNSWPSAAVIGTPELDSSQRVVRSDQQVVDMAKILKVDPDSVCNHTVSTGEDVLEMHSTQMPKPKNPRPQNKRKRWSLDHTLELVEQRRRGLTIRDLGRNFGKSQREVEDWLQELHDVGISILEPPVMVEFHILPQVPQEQIFQKRLQNIWQGLHRSGMTDLWIQALSTKPDHVWLSSITAGIPDEVKQILGGLRPPSYHDLENLPSPNTRDAGVYAKLARSRHGVRLPDEQYVYVGSASSFGGGLQSRVYGHMHDRKSRLSRRFKTKIKKKDLTGPGHFATLMMMEMEMERSDAKALLDVRRTVTLAEAILTIWLGALQNPAEDLEKLCPWTYKLLDYTGWCSHNTLTKDILDPTEYAKEDTEGA